MKPNELRLNNLVYYTSKPYIKNNIISIMYRTMTELTSLRGSKNGHKKLIKKQPKKKAKPKKGYFNPDAVKDNWLFDINENKKT